MSETVTDKSTGELQSLRSEVDRLRRALGERNPAAGAATPESVQQILDAAGVGMVHIGPDGGLLHVNQQLRKLLNLGTRQFAHMTLRDFEARTIWPDGTPCGAGEYPAIKCLQTGEPQPATTIGVQLSAGGVAWLTVTVVPLTDPATGKAAGVLATLMDVTHSRQIEEALRHSEERYWGLVEKTPYAIVVHRDGMIVFVNEAAVSLWGGTSRMQFVGRDILDFVHPKHREAAKRRVEQTMAGETSSSIGQMHLRLDGRVVHVEVTGLPCFYDGQRCVQGILRDVTERKRAERQVRKQREILRKFFDHIPALVGFFDVDGHIKLVNREWKRLLGWGKELPMPELLVRCFPDAEARREIRDFLQAGRGGWQDFRVQTRDGRTLDISAASIVLSTGTRIVIGTDVTERKAAEEALRRSRAELAERVTARTEEISRKNRELELEVAEHRRTELLLQEKQRFMQRMLGVQERDRQLVAYEIHDTFLQDVIGALMFIDPAYADLEETDEQTVARLERARTLLRKAIDEARRMISGLRPPIIDEQGIVAAVEYLINELNGRGMEIAFHHAMHARRLGGVIEATIFRIVQEALTNIERHGQTKHAEVNITQLGDLLRVEVRDFGVGFDRETVGEGHFGLQGIKERARLIGGTISIASLPGQGTDVVLEIPVRPD